MTIKEIEVKSLVLKTAVPPVEFCINPYIGCPHKCMYCYAEFMRRFTGHEEKWGEFLDVKRWNRKINTKKYSGHGIVLSTVTDAYNPFEKHYRITREILAQFEGTAVDVLILTKSNLVLRDIDILKKIPSIKVGLSIATLDDGLRRKIEPGAPAVDKRIDALRVLKEEGIPCYVFISPIFPDLTDVRGIIEACESHTREFHFENLNLHIGGPQRSRVLKFIKKYDPVIYPLYEEIYLCLENSYWEDMEKSIMTFCHERGLKGVSYFFHNKIKNKLQSEVVA